MGKTKKKNSKFNEDFIKKYDKNSNTGYFLEVDIDYPKGYLMVIKIYHFYPKEKRLKKSKNLFVAQKTKKNMLFT